MAMTKLDKRVQIILDASDFNALPYEERKRICKYTREQQILTLWQTLHKDEELTTEAWRRKQREWLADCVAQYTKDFGDFLFGGNGDG